MMFGPITKKIDHDRSCKNNTGLGRQSVMMLQGDGVRTQVICGYNPRGNVKLNSGTTYQQNCRYFIMKDKDLTCPRKCFREDLIKQLEGWRSDGDRLIVCLDTNEDIYKKSIGKALMDEEGLHLFEVVGDFTGQQIVAIFLCDSKPINVVWATPDIVITHACVMPAGFGIGDHRMFVIDMQEETVFGTTPFRVKWFTSRKLNMKVSSGATGKYLRCLEEALTRQRLVEKIGNLHKKCRSKDKLQRELKNWINKAKIS
jgi:hypothetical protein